MQISETGNGLNITIAAQNSPFDDWGAFAAWYSIFKNLPDASVEIFCFEQNFTNQYFNWPRRCGVDFSYKSVLEITTPDFKNALLLNGLVRLAANHIVIMPGVMAIDVFREKSLGPIPAKNEERTTFATYLEGCAKFVLSDWIHIQKNPFPFVERLYSDSMTVNEMRILKLWNKCGTTYFATYGA